MLNNIKNELKNKGAKYIVSFILTILWELMYFPVYTIINALVLMLLYKRGKASKYTNPIYDDVQIPVTQTSLLRRLQKQDLYIVHTDQGQIVIIHGQEDGFAYGGQYINDWSLISMLKRGSYTLISCGNGRHRDLNYNGGRIIVNRDKSTLTNYMTTYAIVGKSLYVYGGKFVDVSVALFSPLLFWKFIPAIIKGKTFEDCVLGK